MAAHMAMPETLVTIKLNIDGVNRRFKLPLRELVPNLLEDKVRHADDHRRLAGHLVSQDRLGAPHASHLFFEFGQYS